MHVIARAFSAAQYWGTRFMIGLIRTVPYRVAITLGRIVGVLLFASMPLRRKLVMVQMEAALGAPDTLRLALRVFMNQGEILVDTVRYAYMDDAEIARRIRVEGNEHLDEALGRGAGVMMITGHIGNWEILSHLPRLLGIQFCVMADVRKDARLESIVDGIRARSGATILPPKGKALMLIRELKRGKIIGMVVDQKGSRSEGLLCDFLGMPAPTNPAPAFIAIKGRALVLPVCALRERTGFVVRFFPAMDAAAFGQGPEAVHVLSQRMQSWVAEVVRRHPDQWFWLHSRWVKRKTASKIIRDGRDFRGSVIDSAGRIPKKGML